jgi:hypothetical protein
MVIKSNVEQNSWERFRFILRDISFTWIFRKDTLTIFILLNINLVLCKKCIVEWWTHISLPHTVIYPHRKKRSVTMMCLDFKKTLCFLPLKHPLWPGPRPCTTHSQHGLGIFQISRLIEIDSQSSLLSSCFIKWATLKFMTSLRKIECIKEYF